MAIFSGPADWWTNKTKGGATWMATKGVVQDDLVFNFDSGATQDLGDTRRTAYVIDFDGNDYMTILNGSPSGNFGTSNFTIEYWFYRDNNNSICRFYDSKSNWQLEMGGTVTKFVDISSGSATARCQNTGTTKDQWVHVAWCRNGTTLRLFYDGILQQSQTVSGSFSDGGTTASPSIGTFSGNTGYYFGGMVSDFRIINGTALYVTNFTPPTVALTPVTDTSLLIAQTTTWEDNGPNNYTVQIGGGDPTSMTSLVGLLPKDAVDQSDSPVEIYFENDLVVGHNQALYEKKYTPGAKEPQALGVLDFVGANPYENNDENYAFIPGNTYTLGSNFTIEIWWFYTDSSRWSDTNQYGDIDTTDGTGSALYTNNCDNDWDYNTQGLIIGANKIQYETNTGSSAVYTISTTGTILGIQEWHQTVLTVNNGTGTWYTDNVQRFTASNFPTIYNANSVGANFGIGIAQKDGSNRDGCFAGYISVLRVYTKTLSASELTKNYNTQRSRYRYGSPMPPG